MMDVGKKRGAVSGASRKFSCPRGMMIVGEEKK
jgi:hypothetical protein